MATRKAASASARTTTKRPAAKKQTTTKVKTTTTRSTRTSSAPAVAVPAHKSNRIVESSTAALVAALIAEFVGTFLLAAGVIVTSGQSLSVFFIIIAAVLAVGAISGGYINPALTIAAWVTRRISLLRAVGYIIAQVLGAMLALVILSAFVGGAAATTDAYGQTSAPQLFQVGNIPSGKEWYVFFAEMLGTLIFGFAVAAATREAKRLTAAVTVGGGLLLGLVVAGSGAAAVGGSSVLNPAVAIAVKGLTWGVWPIATYVFASAIGAIIGFLLFDLLRRFKTAAE